MEKTYPSTETFYIIKDVAQAFGTFQLAKRWLFHAEREYVKGLIQEVLIENLTVYVFEGLIFADIETARIYARQTYDFVTKDMIQETFIDELQEHLTWA